MIGHAQRGSIGALFDQIDRPAQDEPRFEHDWIRQAPRVAPLVVQAETELEILGNPLAMSGEPVRPDAEIAPDIVDFVAPHALDRRREIVLVLRGHTIDHAVQRPYRTGQVRCGDRERTACLQLAEELGLRAMEQAAARQRIHPHERLRLFPRLEAMNRREQELIGARREPLERRE